VLDLITKTPPRPIARPERTTSHVEEIVTRASLKPMDALPFGFKPDAPSLTLWEKIRLLPFLFQSLYGVTVKNWKTTISGIVGALAYAVNALFGLQIPSEAIIAVSLFFVGLFSKDADTAND
jgi:hypothetical protein